MAKMSIPKVEVFHPTTSMSKQFDKCKEELNESVSAFASMIYGEGNVADLQEEMVDMLQAWANLWHLGSTTFKGWRKLDDVYKDVVKKNTERPEAYIEKEE